MDQGFSLTEVLVSLLLITTTSLALIKQQWQVSQVLNQIQTRANALSQLDNATERWYLGYDRTTIIAPFKLYSTQTPTSLASKSLYTGHELQVVLMKITWTSPSLARRSCCTLERRLVGLVNE